MFIPSLSGPLKLEDVKHSLEASGVRVYQKSSRQGEVMSIKVSPFKGKKRCVSSSTRDVELTQDCPCSGPFCGTPLGCVVFGRFGVSASCSLGYILHRHNNYLLNAEKSSCALRFWLSALSYFSPNLNLEKSVIHYVDVTYQFKHPNIDFFSNKIGEAFILNNKGGKNILIDYFRGNIMGEQSKTRRWSGYDKYREVLERDGLKVEDLKGVYRVTERVFSRDPAFPSLFESALEFSQKGLLNLIKQRWDGLPVNIDDSINVSSLISKFGHQAVAQALFYYKFPEKKEEILGAMEDKNKRKNFRKYYKRKILPIVQEVQCQPEKTFVISIPDEEEFNTRWREKIYYI